MKPILFLSVLLALTACASSRYSAREWQRVTTAYDRGQSNPVLERQMSAAANSCVRRYPVR